jgi:hypothetical protein
MRTIIMGGPNRTTKNENENQREEQEENKEGIERHTMEIQEGIKKWPMAMSHGPPARRS